jgi:hypothetical protein
MDFLLLLPHGQRVVLEVDGSRYYTSPDGLPDPAKYVESMREDRELKLSGYEVPVPGLALGTFHLPGYGWASAALLIAVLAVCAATIIHARKRIAWAVDLDMPVGLVAAHARGADAGTADPMLIGDNGARLARLRAGGTDQGWLVMVAVMNSGLARVRGSDFRAPLTFAFPGREVYAAQIDPAPARAGRRRSAARLPTLAAPSSASGWHSTGISPGPAIQLGGDMLLNRNDALMLTLILRGTPVAVSPRISQEGALAGGKIVAALPDGRPHSGPAIALTCTAVLLAAMLLGMVIGGS